MHFDSQWSRPNAPLPPRGSQRTARGEIGPVGPVIDHLRDALEPWTEQSRLDQSHPGPEFRVRINSAVGNDERIRLQVETDTCEVHAFDGPAPLPLTAESSWFLGEAVDSTVKLRLAWTTLPSPVPIRWCIRSTASVPDGRGLRLRPVQVKRTVVALPASAYRRLGPGRIARLHVLPIETVRVRQQALGPADGGAP